MRRPLQLGIIGTGLAATDLYLPAINTLSSRIKLVACANRRRAKAEAFARRAKIAKVVDNAEELIELPEVEAVLLSVPIDQLPKYVLKALKAGKAVLSEKPLAPSVAEGRRLLRAASRFDVPWMVGENFAFMSHVDQLRRWVFKGQLGEIRLIEAVQITRMDRHNPYFNTAWRKRPGHLGGFVLDGGVHLANVVRRIFGMPTDVKGFTATFDPKLAPIDSAVAVLRFESGALGTWTSCFCGQYDGPMLRIYGSRANAELSWDRAILRAAGGREKICTIQQDSFAAEFEHFADVVLRGRTIAMSPEEALQDLMLIESLCRMPTGPASVK